MLLANSQQNGPILNLSRSWIRTGVFMRGLPPPVGEDSAGAPEPWGLRPTESTPPCQGGLGLWRSRGEGRFFAPPTPSAAGRDDGWLTRSSGPEAGYVRRNHRTYSSVARTTSPCSVAVVVYVSRGGASCPSGRPPNASRSSLSFNLSRLGVRVGVPLGGRAGPSYRLVFAGL